MLSKIKNSFKNLTTEEDSQFSTSAEEPLGSYASRTSKDVLERPVSLRGSKEPLPYSSPTVIPEIKSSINTVGESSNLHIRNLQNIVLRNPIEDQEDLNKLVKQINYYLNSNPTVNNIETKQLNAEIYVKGYVFCKKRGQQQFIKKQYVPMSRSKNKPLEDSINNANSNINNLEERIKKIEDGIAEMQENYKNIMQDLDLQRHILNKVVEYIKSNKGGNSYTNKYGNVFNTK